MGPKKAKKTKAELEEERLAREEEERKAKIAEEKRLGEEREKKRLEEARIAAEQKAIREKELERWKGEYNEIVKDLQYRHQQLLNEEKAEELRLEWIRYKDPSDETNAMIEKDMNTFISLTRESPVNEMKDAIESVKRIEKLASNVEDVWANSFASKDYPMQERAFDNLQILREMIFEKIDQATVPLIRFADKYVNDRVEINIEEVAQGVSVGIWGSFNDIRPIRKSVQLEQMGIQLDIPKQLLQQNERFMYRLIRMPLVTYNMEPYMKSKGHNVVTLEHNQHHHTYRHNHHQHHCDIINKCPSTMMSPSLHYHLSNRRHSRRNSNEGLHPAVLVADAVATEKKEETPAAPAPPADTPTPAPADGAAPVTEEHAAAAAAPVEVVEEAPKPKEPTLSTEQLQALNAKYIVGDLIYFDILHAPPTPFNLRAKKWIIRDNSVHSTSIRKSNYPSSVACRMFIKVPDHVSLTDDLRIAIWNEDHHEWTEDGITDYQYSEATRIVQFYITTVGVLALVKKRTSDLPLKKWSLYPVLDKPINKFMNYRHNDAVQANARMMEESAAAEAAANEETAPVTTIPEENTATEENKASEPPSSDANAAPISPPAAAESPTDPNNNNNAAPNNNSELINALNSAIGTNLSNTKSTTFFEKHARLTVHTSIYEVVIDIIGSECYLVKPDAPFCRDLLNKPTTPGILLHRLTKKGIHLIPTDFDLTFSKVCNPKRRVLEDEVWRQLAAAASSLEFTSATAWNTTLNDSQIGVCVRESNVFTCPAEMNEFECILVERDEVSISYQNTSELGFAPGPDNGILYSLVYGNEYGNRPLFSHVLRPHETTHLELSRTLANRITPESMERMKRTNQRFAKTIYTLLSLIKIYSQS